MQASTILCCNKTVISALTCKQWLQSQHRHQNFENSKIFELFVFYTTISLLITSGKFLSFYILLWSSTLQNKRCKMRILKHERLELYQYWLMQLISCHIMWHACHYRCDKCVIFISCFINAIHWLKHSNIGWL